MKAAHSHAHGLVHRDIKPSNILLSDAGEMRIADFGIAKAPDGPQTKMSQFGMGSRNYMAPEQRESAKHVDRRADIYSIGVLAYRMLTGKLPAGRYADPEVVAPQLGKALNGVILKALSEDKETRFRDAGEMLAACEAALKQRAREDQAGNYTGTFTDLSIDGPVSGVPEKYRPLYDTIKETLLAHGAITPRQREIEAMAAVLEVDGEGLKSVVANVTATHREIPALQKLLNLIERELGKLPTQTAGKEAQTQKERLIGDLLPAAELAGKDRDWLEARMQGKPGTAIDAQITRLKAEIQCTLGEQDQSSPRLEPIRAFRDSLADGGEGPLMVVLPAGSFRMGCLNDDGDCFGDEQPVHEVTLPNDFAMAVYAVSFAEYDRYLQVTRARRPDDQGWGRGNRPVIDVNWKEARAYARWLREQAGHSYRLPTEAEWEYAARAGTTTKYSWGNRASTEQANYRGNDGWKNPANTVPVGRFPANDFGLYDMHGNVWEWTQDCWHGSYHGAPTNGQAWNGANGGDCKRRVMRGGSWRNTSWSLRAAFRSRYFVSSRHFHLGFVLSRTCLRRGSFPVRFALFSFSFFFVGLGQGCFRV